MGWRRAQVAAYNHILVAATGERLGTVAIAGRRIVATFKDRGRLSCQSHPYITLALKNS